MGTPAPAAAVPITDPMAAVSAGAGAVTAAAAAVPLLLVDCFVVVVAVAAVPVVADVVLLLLLVAKFTALAVRDDVVTVAPIVGGRLEAKIGDGSICCTKFDGKTPTLLRRRPRHQPSST